MLTHECDIDHKMNLTKEPEHLLQLVICIMFGCRNTQFKVPQLLNLASRLHLCSKSMAPFFQVDVMPTIGEEKYSEDNRLAFWCAWLAFSCDIFMNM